jgi:thiol-disulfide isomerase/thioredoxin
MIARKTFDRRATPNPPSALEAISSIESPSSGLEEKCQSLPDPGLQVGGFRVKSLIQMKISSVIVVASLLTGITLRAEEETKPQAAQPAPKEAKEASPADAAWAEVEGLLKGPKVRPKTRDEAAGIFKTYIAELDEKSAAFLKAYPNDARRWKLKLQQVQVNGARQALQIAPLSEADLSTMLDGIIAAGDADKETKEMASYFRVMQSADNEAEFNQLATAHIKAFPDFKGNASLEQQLKKVEAQKALKEKPLELAFKATDGTEVDLSKMRGKVVLVDFWATWCGPCIAEIPNVVATYTKLHDKGFEIIGISFDKAGDEAKLASMTTEKKMPWPQFFDGAGWKNKYGQQFGINSIPAMWLINKKGMVVDFNGRKDLEAKVEKLLAE